MNYDMHNNVNDEKVLAPIVIAADTTTNGEIIDTAGYDSLEFLISSGVITDGAYTTVLQESDDPAMSGATAVSDAQTLGDLPAFGLTEDGITKRVGFVGKMRYVRLQLVSTGTTVGGLFSTVAVQGKPSSAPVA